MKNNAGLPSVLFSFVLFWARWRGQPTKSCICNSSKALPTPTAAKLVNLHCSWEAFDFTKQKRSRSQKGSFLGSDAKIRKWTLQGSSRKKKGEAATQRSWGREEHKNSTKPISLDARKQDEREGVYLCLDFKYLRGQKKIQWRETDDLVHVEKKEDERTVN